MDNLEILDRLEDLLLSIEGALGEYSGVERNYCPNHLLDVKTAQESLKELIHDIEVSNEPNT